MLYMQGDTRLAELRSIFRQKEVDVTNAFGVGFYEYFKPVFNDPPRFDEYAKFCKRVFDLTGARKKKVLDLGCGFGLMSIHFALFGASDVFAVDVDKQRLSAFERILSMLEPPLENVHLVLGGDGKIDSKDDFFDVVIMVDTISYIKRLRAFFLEARRVLKSEGVLFISETNNVLNLFGNTAYRRHIKAAQTHDVKLLEKGIEEILNEYPCVSLDELEKLGSAEKLRLSKKDIFWIAEASTRRQEFNPFQLKIMLDDVGFEARVIRPLRSHTSSGLRGRIASEFFTIVALTHPISLVVAPYFNILALNKS
jgi:ubiquinone/menaquinone biosynthesis C-methylase UbiE